VPGPIVGLGGGWRETLGAGGTDVVIFDLGGA
jgi:hypothetical protein